MLKNKYINLSKIFLLICGILLLFFVTNFVTNKFSLVSVFESDFVVDENRKSETKDSVEEEYNNWLEEFDVNPEKFNSFVEKNQEFPSSN